MNSIINIFIFLMVTFYLVTMEIYDPALPEYYRDVSQSDDDKNYKGHAMIRVRADDEDQLRMLQALEQETETNKIEFLRSPSLIRRNVDILVPPDSKDYLTALMIANGFSPRILHNDIQILIESADKYKLKTSSKFNISSYNTYELIVKYLKKLEKYCKFCSITELGLTYEKRKILLFKINKTSKYHQENIFMDAGFHAREWITITSALQLITNLLDEKDKISQFLLKKFVFHIVPVANPDGYEFSRIKDRMWRKNRSVLNGSQCHGVDLNRNFGVRFGGPGALPNPCRESYHGSTSFSEPETRGISQYLLRQKFIGYLSVHSYSQLILTPYGYTTHLPDNFDRLIKLGDAMANAIKKAYFNTYNVGSIGRDLYLSSGCSVDWVLDIARIPYTLTIEMRDNGVNGFILPESEIDPTGKELITAAKAMCLEILKQLKEGKPGRREE